MNPAPSTAPSARTNRSIRVEAPLAKPLAQEPSEPGAPAASRAPSKKTKRASPRLQKVRLAALGRRMREALSAASVVALLAALAVAGREGHRWLVTTARFRAREVIVSGLGRTTRDEVLRAANLTPERNVLSIDCDAAARALEGLPWVSRARVTRRLPGHVDVTVEERGAVALVAAGAMYLVGPDGALFKRAMPGDPADLPVVTGIGRDEFEEDPDGAREGVRDALALLSDVEASAVGAPLRVDEVHREPTGDLSIVVDGTHVWLGRGPYRAKLTRLRVVMRELARRALRGSEIHLESDRHPERVTVRTAAPR